MEKGLTLMITHLGLSLAYPCVKCGHYHLEDELENQKCQVCRRSDVREKVRCVFCTVFSDTELCSICREYKNDFDIFDLE